MEILGFFNLKTVNSGRKSLDEKITLVSSDHSAVPRASGASNPLVNVSRIPFIGITLVWTKLALDAKALFGLTTVTYHHCDAMKSFNIHKSTSGNLFEGVLSFFTFFHQRRTISVAQYFDIQLCTWLFYELFILLQNDVISRSHCLLHFSPHCLGAHPFPFNLLFGVKDFEEIAWKKIDLNNWPIK